MNTNIVSIISWLCFTVIACTLISGVTYYNVVKPSRLEIMERMVRDQGIHPMVFRCMQMDMNLSGNFEVCKAVAKRINLTTEQEERFESLLDSDRRQ